MLAGTVVGLHRSPAPRAGMERLDEAVIRTDGGLDGDHHNRPGSSRQVVLTEAEVLDQLGLQPGQMREQLCVRGLYPLAAGDVLEIGDTRLELVKPRVPCTRMDEVRPGLRAELEGRGGWCARVVTGGVVRTGDRVARGRVDDPPWVDDYRSALAEYEASPPAPDVPGWGLHERLAHFVAWNERCVARLDALAAGAPQEHLTAEQVDEFNARAVERLVPGATRAHLYLLHDLSTTAVVEAARRHGDLARDWLENLARHYREHAQAAAVTA